MQVYEKLVKAHKVSCPIVTLTTADPAQSIRKVCEALPASYVVNWDCVKGAAAPTGQKKHAQAKAAADKIGEEVDLTSALEAAVDLSSGTVMIVQNAHKFLDSPAVIQAIWNLRDPFKSPKRMLILMGPSIRIPVELQNDVVELDEPLPTVEELQQVVEAMVDAAGVKCDKSSKKDAAIASTGLSAFAAEQYVALNLSKTGLDAVGVWDDKCRKIDETPGLQVISGGSFDDVAGVENAKRFLTRVMNGKGKPNAIVFVDEIEKALGGSGTDTSGVSQDQLGVLLQWMQDKRASGCIFVGPPGAAKSALAKTAGGEGGIPTIQLDLGGMKGSLVGESETRIRDALKVVDAVSGGNTLWIATSNGLANIPPELKRRFRYGTWFFDLPAEAERRAIWQMYTDKFFGQADVPEELIYEEWTGAEIESCCEIADRTSCTLVEAAEYIVPVSKSAAQVVEALRAGADGKFLSASHSGTYKREQEQQVAVARQFD